MLGSTATPAASCKKLRRGRFVSIMIWLPSASDTIQRLGATCKLFSRRLMVDHGATSQFVGAGTRPVPTACKMLIYLLYLFTAANSLALWDAPKKYTGAHLRTNFEAGDSM